MTAPLRVERIGALAVLTFDRPDVLNAIDGSMTSALAEQLQGCAADPGVRAVVLTGAGRAFSSGQDLRDRAAMVAGAEELHLGRELRRRYHPIVRALREMRKPAIAAVNGICLGAGLGIALACDLRVAAASASFRAAWSRIGLAPDAGAAFFLPRLVGLGRAMEMVLTGEPVGAEDALRVGLVGRVWPDAAFEREWRAYAAAIAEGPTEAFALSKDALNASGDRDLGAFLELEVELQERAGRTADYAEGVSAFAQKRPARFQGR